MTSSSNTRSQLAQFENEWVVMQGTLKEVRKKRDGCTDVLLVNCKVRKFDPNVVLADVEPVYVDHCWDRYSPDRKRDPDEAPNKLLDSYSSIGKVQQYARADGSVDWRIETQACIRLDNVIMKMVNKFESGVCKDHRARRHRNFGMVLAAVEEGIPVYSYQLCTNEVLDMVRNRFEQIETQIALEALAPANGPCKKLRALRLPGRSHQKARGFA
ncbi:hypothetical protein N9C85_01025 [Synechococcus sp. AH-224-I15]|nr:hypothetical protein [Synechococcus sp. AH-224-I15]